MAQIARVSYAYNSSLEDNGAPGYFLDAYVSRDGETVVDVHEAYKTRQEFFDAIGEIIPVIDSGSAAEAEDLQDDSYEQGGA